MKKVERRNVYVEGDTERRQRKAVPTIGGKGCFESKYYSRLNNSLLTLQRRQSTIWRLLQRRLH